MSSDRIEEQMKAREERRERRALTTNTLIKIPRAVHFHYFWTAVGALYHSYKLPFNMMCADSVLVDNVGIPTFVSFMS